MEVYLHVCVCSVKRGKYILKQNTVYLLYAVRTHRSNRVRACRRHGWLGYCAFKTAATVAYVDASSTVLECMTSNAWSKVEQKTVAALPCRGPCASSGIWNT